MDVAAGFINLPGGSEWMIIFLVMLIIFGPKSLPKIGHAVGKGIREFKDASNGITKAIEEETSNHEDESSSESNYNYEYEEPDESSADEPVDVAAEGTTSIDEEMSIEDDEAKTRSGDSSDPSKSEEFKD